MKKVIAYILYLCIIVGTAFSVTIKTEQDVPVQDPAGNDVYKGDQISLHLVPPESYNFGITTSSYALTAEHMEEDIILDPVENGRQISSVLNSENKNLFVFYRVYGDDSFDLSFRLSGPLVGYFENANKLDWGVKWHDDNNVLHGEGKDCGPNPRYLEPEGEPLMYVSYMEQNFILAEAALRGWISGNASDYYKTAIRASMEFIANVTPDDENFHHGHPITDAYITEYLAQDKIQLNGDFNHDLEMILLQKYLGSFLQHPENDCFYDNRRTGYPVFG